MAGKNIIEKIWQDHVVSQEAKHPAVFAIDFALLHEVTSAQAFEELEARGLKVWDPNRFLATIDHSIPTRHDRHIIHDEAAKKQVELLRMDTQKHEIRYYGFGSTHQGIVHVIGPELGVTQPGMTIVCGDSHTSTHGAFGALAFGIGSSTLTHVLATGCILLQKPKVMQVEFKGHFRKGVFSKDAIMKLIAEIGIKGANGHVIEYCGEAIKKMSMEERMTICNMSIECGAKAGLISPDQTTYEYIRDRKFAPSADNWDRAVIHWNNFYSDPGCAYDKSIVIDLDTLHPMVTWGTNPGQAIQVNESIPELTDLHAEQRISAERALDYIKLKPGDAIQDTPVDWTFVGSCTNGRISDLRIVAKILQDRRVHPNVTMYIVPGSEAVLEQARNEGLDEIFINAGADFRMPGCSMCIGMNDDKVPPGKRCISATNRNFVGRQGPGSKTHIASPATVAASAIEGKITSAEKYL
ncbi:MAG: 3-isopropylmalate dehydratase large subunit [Gammaproteobacteria bacterium]